jgi:hypothetical protein
MSATKPTEAERRCRTFRCERCGADVGQPCVTTSGRYATYDHAERFYAATAAGLLPLDAKPPVRDEGSGT